VTGDPGVPVGVGTDTVTVVNGSTFCISRPGGDIGAELAQGLFYCDTRIVSGWQLRVGGETPDLLAVLSDEPFRARIVARVVISDQRVELLLERDRLVGSGMREDLLLRNLSSTAVNTNVSLGIAADFAGLFSVKDGRPALDGSVSTDVDGESMTLNWVYRGFARGVRVSAGGAVARHDGLHFTVNVPARGEWRTSVIVTPSIDGSEVAGGFPIEQPCSHAPREPQTHIWRGAGLDSETANGPLQQALEQSQKDLGTLRISDPDHPEEVAVAAGAPWFMTLFGRDSLLASYMALPLDPLLALGTLRALGRVQGTRLDLASEEQPGRIVHEIRRGLDFPLRPDGGKSYYGSADATPLFVIVLGELRRWGIAPLEGDGLLDNADRALEWIRDYGDRDGDGFVEYERMTDHGLVNQGWKDSEDGINFADGTLAEPPIALCEVQGYVYAAYLARADLAEANGDIDTANRCALAAARIRRLFNETFWLPDKGWFAVGLDRDKRPIDALTSNIGHCLWTGIIDEDKAPLVAERLMSAEMFNGWGVRTLATSMGAYNPLSYHNGSVWPHDSALVAAGLMRYGYVAEAQQIASGLLDAAAHFDGRLPELICGFDRADYGIPVAYPASCSPQAWASATPVHLVRTLLRLQPDIPDGNVWIAPVWPQRFGAMTMHHLALGRSFAELYVDHESSVLRGLPSGLSVRHGLGPGWLALEPQLS
jgi:glycogen debranching enzyme